MQESYRCSLFILLFCVRNSWETHHRLSSWASRQKTPHIQGPRAPAPLWAAGFGLGSLPHDPMQQGEEHPNMFEGRTAPDAAFPLLSCRCNLHLMSQNPLPNHHFCINVPLSTNSAFLPEPAGLIDGVVLGHPCSRLTTAH